MRAYVLIRAAKGEAQRVARTLEDSCDQRLRVLHVDAVFGPYDVVLECESRSLDDFAEALGQIVHGVPGVVQTTTCLAIQVA